MRENQMVPIGENRFQIILDTDCDEQIKGMVISNSQHRSANFSSLSRMLLLIESWLDSPSKGEIMLTDSDRKIDYEIEIIFRHNYTWQGKLIDLHNHTEATFRSVLELLIQLETALIK